MLAPYAIFERAEAYWESARYPKQLSYAVTISVWNGGIVSSAHYHSSYDLRTGKIFVSAVSDEELAHPYTPHGANVVLRILNGNTPISAPQRTFDYLGVPVLAPNYSFGLRISRPSVNQTDSAALVREIRREFHDPMPRGRKPQDTQLKTIAEVTTASRNYIVALAGVEPLDGHDDYHLLLQPIVNPRKYRLREVWVDTVSFATDKLVTQGNFMQGGPAAVPWTVTFKQVDSAPYIVSESTKSAFSLVRHHCDAATVTFDQVTPQGPPPFSNLRTFEINTETGVPPLIEP